MKRKHSLTWMWLSSRGEVNCAWYTGQTFGIYRYWDRLLGFIDTEIALDVTLSGISWGGQSAFSFHHGMDWIGHDVPSSLASKTIFTIGKSTPIRPTSPWSDIQTFIPCGLPDIITPWLRLTLHPGGVNACHHGFTPAGVCLRLPCWASGYFGRRGGVRSGKWVSAAGWLLCYMEREGWGIWGRNLCGWLSVVCP